MLFTDKSTLEKIEKLLTDEKYTTPLKLVVEECDKEKLKAQEEARKERAFPEQKKTFTQAGRGKKKGIIFNKTHMYTFLNLSKIIVMVNWMYWMH